jgi:predicted CXXCH cytochrome family protein
MIVPKTLIIVPALAVIAAASLQPLSATMQKQEALPVATKPAPSTAVDPTTCTEAGCHPDVLDHDVIHGPVSVNACEACHILDDPATHTYRQAREGLELCAFCHDVRAEDAPYVHAPMITGDCTACHDSHGGTDRKFLKAQSSSDLCTQCHDNVMDGSGSTHGPVAAGACAACHTPHTSQYEHLLIAEGRELCLSCHVSTAGQLQNARVMHGPVASDCQVCHDAHASDHPMILHDEPEKLCLSCHETIANIVSNASQQHAAVTTERACLNCHEPHASDFPRVLRMKSTDLCFECHDKEIKLEDGTTLGNIKKVLDSGTSLHGPVAQDNCAACHEIHGGGHFRLLVQEYPANFYAPFKEESYALCFSCHNAEIVRDARTTALTDFRNGDENLHYLHVNRDKKGRTCRACHETHASNRQKHVRDSVPFGSGGWELPIRFEKTDTGGSCAPGCHVSYEYDRDHPVSYGNPDPEAVWPANGDKIPAPDAPEKESTP